MEINQKRPQKDMAQVESQLNFGIPCNTDLAEPLLIVFPMLLDRITGFFLSLPEITFSSPTF